MKLTELFSQPAPGQIDFDSYKRSSTDRTKLPPLDNTGIVLESLVLKQRDRLIIPAEGDASLLLSYKGYEGAITSLKEHENGEEWRIVQVQGAKSRKSFRLTSGLNWQTLFGDEIARYTKDPDSQARQLTMPQLIDISCIEAAQSAAIESTYALVRRALKMRFSQELGLYIADIPR